MAVANCGIAKSPQAPAWQKMGNAMESLKTEADYTTTSVDDDGMLNALRHFNLV